MHNLEEQSGEFQHTGRGHPHDQTKSNGWYLH